MYYSVKEMPNTWALIHLWLKECCDTHKIYLHLRVIVVVILIPKNTCALIHICVQQASHLCATRIATAPNQNMCIIHSNNLGVYQSTAMWFSANFLTEWYTYQIRVKKWALPWDTWIWLMRSSTNSTQTPAQNEHCKCHKHALEDWPHARRPGTVADCAQRI